MKENKDGTISIRTSKSCVISKFLSSESYAYKAKLISAEDVFHYYTFTDNELKFDTTTIRYKGGGVLTIHGIYYKNTKYIWTESSIFRGVITSKKYDKLVYVDNGVL